MDVFTYVPLPFQKDSWGVQLFHEDTDTHPLCFVVFGTNKGPNAIVEVEFEGATYASARPKRDDEEIATSPAIPFPRRRLGQKTGEENHSRTPNEGLKVGPEF